VLSVQRTFESALFCYWI